MALNLQSLKVMKLLSLFFLFFSLTYNAQAETVEISLSGGSLALRTKASVNSQACTRLKSGEKLEKLGEKDGWFQVKINKPGCPKTAWLHGYYTKKYYKGSQKLSYLNKNWSPTPKHETSQAYSELTQLNFSKDSNKAPLSNELGISTSGSVARPRPSQNRQVSVLAPKTSIRPKARPQAQRDDISLDTKDFSDSDVRLCRFTKNNGELENVRTNNCLRLIRLAQQGKISQDALKYSIKYLKANLGQLKDSSCIGSGKPSGIKNSCQFIINDFNKKIRGYSNRSPLHFIDLCDGSPASAHKGLLTSTYVNRGTGSARGRYTDLNKRKTSLVGAFLTGPLSTFTPYRVSQKYRNIGWDQNCARGSVSSCPVWRLEMYGAQSSNNSTDNSKPMHVSPYYSSWGCPSINLSKRWMFRVLNERGPSMVMNYGPKRYHTDQSIHNCKNQ